MESPYNDEIINDFLTGKLKGKSLDEFKAALKSDTYLQEEVAFYKSLNENLRNLEFQHIRQRGEDLYNRNEKKIKEQSKERKISLWKPLVAFIVIIIMLLIYFNKNNIEPTKEPDYAEIAQDAWNRSPELPYIALRLNESKDSLQQIIHESYRAYKKKNCVQTYSNIVIFEEGSAYYEDALLLQALCKYKEAKKEVALNLLNKALPIARKRKYFVQWYLSLIYLEKGKIEAAKTLLTKLNKGQWQGEENAQQLLKQLNNL